MSMSFSSKNLPVDPAAGAVGAIDSTQLQLGQVRFLELETWFEGLWWQGYVAPGLVLVFYSLALMVCVILCVAYLTLAERKIMGFMQRRKGPNVVGPFGLAQPFADAIKLLFKEPLFPQFADKFVFFLAPLLTFFLALVAWAVIPLDDGLVIADINLGVLYIFAVSSLAVYGIIMAGWSSNSKYAFLGALRSSAQMISYEVSMGFILISVLLTAGSLNLTEIVRSQASMWYCIPLFPVFVLFFISALAETNRAPFDLPESESELVSGYNVEYSGVLFVLFFLAEYGNMILMSALTSILFLGGWLPPVSVPPFSSIPGFFWLALKTALVLFCFIWVRATFPRYRYDQLMRLGWKVFLPISLFWLVLVASVLYWHDKI